MVTLRQLLKLKTIRKYKITKKRSPALQKCPQKKGICTKIFVTTPRKPNSAERKVARVTLTSHTKKRNILAYITGEGDRKELKRFTVVLIRGNGPHDIPGQIYTIIRHKYDVAALVNRERKRSKYGAIAYTLRLKRNALFEKKKISLKRTFFIIFTEYFNQLKKKRNDTYKK
jgi:small subunit ribosomal protein S12